MKELTVFEMKEVAAAGLSINADTLSAAALGAVTYAVWGTLIGGTQSGANGGLLGFGLIGNAVGAIWGFIAGGITGAAYGLPSRWDTTLASVEKSFHNAKDGKIVPWSIYQVPLRASRRCASSRQPSSCGWLASRCP